MEHLWSRAVAISGKQTQTRKPQNPWLLAILSIACHHLLKLLYGKEGGGGPATVLQAVARDGRLATITGDPPAPERGVAVADVYVRGDGARLAELVVALADEILSLHVAATLPLAEAAAALRDAVTGRSKGANVLTLDRS